MPALDDVVTIGTGNSGLYTDVTVGAVNVDDGVLWINRNGVLNAGTVNVTGGELALSRGNPKAATNPGPQGIANISTLLNISGGTVDRPGLITLGASGTVTQSGGLVDAVQINTPSYGQTGGTMNGQVTASTYAISGAEGGAASQMGGAVYLGDQFTMADGALVNGWVAGDGSAAMLQTGGTMEGSASGLTSYTQTGGTLAGSIVFSDLFELSGNGEIGWVDLIGSTEAEFNQSGGIMGGIVYAPVGSEGMTGIAKYTQTGGDMAYGWVTTRVYEASGGGVNGTVDFSELFALSGDASVGDFYINGDGDAAMTQSGNTVMGGEVSGIATYAMSGGTLTGKVKFADHFDLSGGEVGFVDIFGNADATMTQSGGTMGGWVHAADGDGFIEKYTQTGGDMTRYVTTRNYEMSGGTISDWVDVSQLFELKDGTVTASGILSGWGSASVAQSGGTLGGEASDIVGYDQSGGSMTGFVATGSYDLSGGSVSGQVNFIDQFSLSGTGEVVAGATLSGQGGASQMTQSGGTMSGHVNAITTYTQSDGTMDGLVDAGSYSQSGGTMSGAANIASYVQSGGTLSGEVGFGTQFTLSGTGEVTSAGSLVGDGSATMNQAGGTMGGTVSGVTLYTQSGGVMSGAVASSAGYTQSAGTMGGAVTAQTYGLSGGTVSGQASFGTQFTLSGTGEVTSAGSLVGDGSATMNQAGGTMGGTVSGVTGYTQSGGAMGGKVTAGTYTMSGGTLSGEAAGFSSFLLSGGQDVVVSGTLVGASGSTVTQTGGKMNGNVSGIANYTQQERVGSSAVINFSQLYQLVDGQVDTGARIIGGAGSTMTQTGPGKMQGAVTGVSTYTQTAGTMNGSVSTGSYGLSSGTLSGTANFSSAFTLGSAGAPQSGQINGSALLNGGAGSTMTQLGGSMKGTVSGVTSYTQTAGDMGGIQANTNALVGKVGTATYALSGGTVVGQVDFSSLFTLTATGVVASTAKLVGGSGSTMTQSASTMGGTVSGVTSYSQSGGTLTGTLSGETYTLSGGALTGGANISTLFALGATGEVTATGAVVGGGTASVTQAGGTMNGTVTGAVGYAQSAGTMAGSAAATNYVQSGGTMSGAVTAPSYALSGGTLSGDADFATLFALSGSGSVTSTAQLSGGAGATMTQSAGSMGGTVTGVGSYSQSGGTMTGTVTGDAYGLSGGALTGGANISTLFALGATGEVTATGAVIGGGTASVTQAGGTMNGTVTGAVGYTQSAGTMAGSAAATNYVQSGGTMSGAVTAPSYALSGGTLSGNADFATLFALSGTGSVTSTAQLSGGAGATMTQSGGSMDGTVTGIEVYTQSGGSMTGAVTTIDYNHAGGSATGTIDVANYSLSGASATWDGTITASNAFNLGFDDGFATVDARLSGTGTVVKTGTSTVILANGANDFSGAVAVNGGVLEIKNAALPGQATVTVANNATLRFNTAAGISTQFDGNMSGATGLLEKTGLSALTLSGDINMGALLVNGGLLNIGNGAPEEASFDSAYIALGARLYVASGATLRIRIPKNIANFGTLTNDGTVYDDLDNAGMFVNNAVYVANVASNTRDIANNAPGVWTGDVLTNNGWINNNEDATWNGNVVSNAALGTNGQPGRIANAGGTWRGDVLSNAGHIINDNRADEIGTGYWIGDIYGNTNWIFNGGGGDWTGDVIANAGAVMNGKPAVWHGDVRSNSDLVWNGGVWNGKVLGNAGTFHNAGGTWNGNVEANSGLIQNIAGTDAHGSTGGSTWIGDVVTNAGTIFNADDSTWTGNVLGNSGTIDTRGLWTGNFTNAGTVKAQNQIVGLFTNNGTLRVTGNLAGITTLTNSGIIDMTGGGSQVLSVGAASFGSGSVLDVQIDPNGLADRIEIIGTASLGGTVRVSSGGAPHTNGPFTIVNAGDISGTFDAVTTDLAFLSPRLSYDAQSVTVSIQRNDLDFEALGATGNQAGTAAAVEALGAGNALYEAVLWLTEAEAQSALSQLSGEPHASQVSGAVESANAIGQMAADRVAQVFAVLGEGDSQASGYAESVTPMAATKPRNNAMWGQFYGAHGVVDAGSGTAGVVSSAGGVVLGLDGLLADWRLGMMLQGGFTGTQVSALNASASSTDYGVGIYGGRQFGDTQFSFGATYTRHLNSTTRQVSFPGYVDTLSGSYGSGTSQVFANVSQAFDFGAVSLKPYAGLAYVSHSADGFTETGGAAALSSAANLLNATFASLGLGVEQQFVVGNDMLLTASGSIGWRHAFAETPISTHQFGAGPSFTIAGKPVASDLLTLGAGLALDVGGGVNLDLTYTGQVGGGTQAHALQGVWSQQF